MSQATTGPQEKNQVTDPKELKQLMDKASKGMKANQQRMNASLAIGILDCWRGQIHVISNPMLSDNQIIVSENVYEEFRKEADRRNLPRKDIDADGRSKETTPEEG